MGLYHWHIGGKNNLAVHRVISTFREMANA